MNVSRATLEDCAHAPGTVVIIDVLRAITTACYAFQAGAGEIILAGTVEHALHLRSRFPGSLISGEIDGFPVAGFDLPNSPSALRHWDLRGVRLIQRTTAGSQGVLLSERASTILAACLCNLSATARFLQTEPAVSITLVETGVQPGGWGDEDKACADAIHALLEDRAIPRAELHSRVSQSKSGRYYTDPSNPVFPSSDLELALRIDSFPHPIGITRRGSDLVMSPIRQ
jgi:2-phosphosulfolactate phosphatase